MPITPKKLAVLNQLQLENAEISLHDLLHKLGSSYAERSVRRWLTELVQTGEVGKSGNKRATKYFAKQSSQIIDLNSCFSQQSMDVIKKIKRPLYERIPISYVDRWINEYTPNVTFYMPTNLRIQLNKAGKRSKASEPAGTYAHLIYNRLLIDLSYNSSRLEGNTYSLLDTERLVLEGAGAEGKLDEEKIMILNHKEAIRYLVDNASRLKISEQTICTLHYLLADGLIESRFAGKVRDHGVRMGGSSYIPYEAPTQIKLQLQQITNKAALIRDPYEQSLFLLIHISYLQAFTDVNKRTARLSANIPLIANNFVPLSFNDIGKEDYISALIAIYELQDVRPIIDLYVYSYLRTCVSYDLTVKTISYDEVRVRYRAQRRAVLHQIIIDNLVGEAMENLIKLRASEIPAEEAQHNFVVDVHEDIEQIDESRIAGLGITTDQLKIWLHLYRSNKGNTQS